MTKPTRTVNPLHFEDLDPHRFEDLCRQLIYDFREWSSIEAIGRCGSDDGIDVRAIELLRGGGNHGDEEDSGDEVTVPLTQRTWIIQCKRERSISPKKTGTIVADFFSRSSDSTYGYILVGACDFSKAARDAFRSAMVQRRVQEFYLWGKGELEDMLYLPKNDHLLFAYFGISLQVARRSLRTDVSGLLTTKRRVVRALGPIRSHGHQQVLIRDPRNPDYPSVHDVEQFLRSPAWTYCAMDGHWPVNHVAFLVRQYFAYADFDKEEWDALLDYDNACGPHQVHGVRDSPYPNDDKRLKYHRYWQEKIPETNRAWLNVYRWIPYTRIVAIDDLGDVANAGPHMLVEYRVDDDPFEPESRACIERCGMLHGNFLAAKEKRVKYFPEIIQDHESAQA
jgi:hypothetical protein